MVVRSRKGSGCAARHLGRCRLAAAIVFLSVLAGLSPAAQNADEFRLKAAFIYRFPQFVEWPERVLEGRKTIDLCVFGPGPLEHVLSELVEGERLAGRNLVVRHVDGSDPVHTCQVLVLSGTASSRRVVLQRVATHPVLTVSDAPGFLDEGGIVLLRVVDNRMRFEINASAAERAGLRLSSQLLRLALDVRGGPS